MKRTSKAQWEARVKAWKESGEPATAFARANGVTVRALRWWRWRLNALARDEALVKKSIPAPVSVSFVEVPVETIPIYEHRGVLEVVLPSKLAIRVSPGFDASTLSALLDLLESRR